VSREMPEPGKTDRSFFLEGLNCVTCAAAIEKLSSRLYWVQEATVDTVTSRLTLKLKQTPSEEEMISTLQNLIEGIEPGVKVLPVDLSDNSFLDPLRRRALRMFSVRVLPGLIFWALAASLPLEKGISTALFIAAYLVPGWSVLGRALKNIFRGRIFNEYLLMSAATIGAISIGEFPEAVAVMLFFRTGEILEESAVEKARGSISSLVEIIPDKANLVTEEGDISQVPSRSVSTGDRILVRPGERVPVDCIVTEGFSSLDTSSITGESMPRDVAPGDTLLAGSLNQGGTLRAETSRPLEASAASRILKAIGNAGSRKTNTERFVTSIAKYYTPAIVIAASLLAVIPPLAGWGSFETWLYRALVFLVVSCPCALLISIPLGIFAGIGSASSRGILIKGGDILERLWRVKTIFLDKTGTLTNGEFQLAGVFPSSGRSPESLLRLAVTAETDSNHPLAAAVRSGWGERPLPEPPLSALESPGLGIETRTREGRVLAGNRRFMLENGIEALDPKKTGTVIHVAEGKNYAGFLVVEDTVKPEAYDAIRSLRDIGIERIFLLSGDLEASTSEVAENLELDGSFGGLLPEEKVGLLEEEQGSGMGKGVTVFVGDGMNDAPVIARADVGISMGRVASDVTVDNADVVIMNDKVTGIPDLLMIARKTKRVIWQNIALALGVKAGVLLLGAFGVASLWEAVFADVGVTVLAVLNSSRIHSINRSSGPRHYKNRGLFRPRS